MIYPRILAVITARGGSKRIPNKNIKPLNGKPLIAWTLEAAAECKDLLHAIVLSTDDDEIAVAGRRYGAEVPFLRPSNLSSDDARSLGVVQHATHFIEQRDQVQMDWILLLQPTSPLRIALDIRHAIKMAITQECDSVVSVAESPIHPVYIKKIDAKGLLQPFILEEPEGLRRQEVTPTAFIRNGAIYLTQRDTLMNGHSIFGSQIKPYFMPAERSVDIDTPFDFELAEFLLRTQPMKGK
jgi:CMP-N,N'-diacetyllegionaminic acid synthase